MNYLQFVVKIGDKFNNLPYNFGYTEITWKITRDDEIV